MPLSPAAANPISEFKIPGIEVRVVQLLNGPDPVLFPPRVRELYPNGAIDGSGSLSVFWQDEKGRQYDAVVLVEAT